MDKISGFFKQSVELFPDTHFDCIGRDLFDI